MRDKPNINQVLEKLDSYLQRANHVLEHRLDNTVFYVSFSHNGSQWSVPLYKPRVNIVLKKVESNDTELCFIIIITLAECQKDRPFMFYIKYSLPIEDTPEEILNNIKLNTRLNFGVSTYSSFTKAYIQQVLDVIKGAYLSNHVVWQSNLGSTLGQFYQNYGYAKTGVRECTNQVIRLIPLLSLSRGVSLVGSTIQVDLFKPYYHVTTGGEPLFLTATHDKFKHVYTYSKAYNAYTLGYNDLM